MSDIMNATRYPVHWLEVVPVRRRKSILVGVCGRMRAIYTVASSSGMAAWAPLIVHDLYANDEQCEESRRCLNRACSLNQTTPASLCAGLGLKKVPKWMTSIVTPIVDAELQAEIDDLCTHFPDQGMIRVSH